MLLAVGCSVVLCTALQPFRLPIDLKMMNPWISKLKQETRPQSWFNQRSNVHLHAFSLIFFPTADAQLLRALASHAVWHHGERHISQASNKTRAYSYSSAATASRGLHEELSQVINESSV
jgi:hypothetical protein